MKQKYAMMETEGNAWLNRNHDLLGKRDPVTEMVLNTGLNPTNIVEVGCSNGWRLDKLRKLFGGAKVMGVEPSLKACLAATEAGIPIVHSTASCLPMTTCDLLIYGFCLYLTDPSDWFKIVAEGDRLLADNGHVIIHDFEADGPPFARAYEHHPGMLSYHVDFKNFWLAHPLYSLVGSHYADDESVVVLKKHPRQHIQVIR